MLSAEILRIFAAIFSIAQVKRVLYFYNPETDNFERVYPTLRSVCMKMLKYLAAGTILGALAFFCVFYIFETPTEENLKEENSQLRRNYRIMSARVEDALKVMSDIANRDDNFYRAVMQTAPLHPDMRLAAKEDLSTSTGNLTSLSQERMTSELNRRISLLEHQIYIQSLSFDELRESAALADDKAARIPSRSPLESISIPISSGFGYRRDPFRGIMKLHSGIDWAVAEGTPIYAPALATVKKVGRNAVNGTFIELDHGYNYTTLYSHLDSATVKEGETISRGGLLGYSGSSGISAAPHLHYEVRFKETAQNPVNYLFADLSPTEYEKKLHEAENAGMALD